ncbi:hypothetical protein NQ315_016621 [Exocentrus adspersus]|uniref:Beta-casein n=1 Tax=Exocentrus adspersus TaxID=1586481 RepID=A0AAV8VP82_9CUCU|nr:hypothetical protein NQ315_016621 [Exocentrus adspersus]
MMYLFVLALAVVPGLQSAVVQSGDSPIITTFPIINADGQVVQIQTLPAFILPESVEPEPEVEAVVPELINVNPCDSCFEYMSALIEQLTVGALPEAHPMPEVEVVPEDEGLEILPHPMPQFEVDPEDDGIFHILPHPMPQFEVVPEVEIRPHPLPSVEVVPESETVPEIRPLPIEYLRI